MKRIVLFFAAAAAVLTGCSKDEEMPVVPVESGAITEIVAELPPEARVYMGAGYKVYWEEGDQITVWNDKGESVNFLFEKYVDGDTQKGRFNIIGEKELTGSRFYAVYPATTLALKNGSGSYVKTVSTTLPKNQIYRAPFEGNNPTYSHDVAPLAAQTTDINAKYKQAEFKFYNLCSLIEVQLQGATDVVVTKVSLKAAINASTAAGLCGEASINFPNTVTGKPTLTSSDDAQTELVINGLTSAGAENGLVMHPTNPETLYFVVPSNVAVDKLTFTISTSTGVTVAKSRTFSAKKFVAGTLYQLGAVLDVVAPKKYTVGDIYPNSEKPEGVVFAVEIGETNGVKLYSSDAGVLGLHGKIVALNNLGGTAENTMGSMYTWATEDLGKWVKGFSYTDGWNNLQTALEKDPTLNKFPAFKACQDFGAKWYLPSKDEFTTVVGQGANIVTALQDHGGSMLPDANYWSSNNDGGEWGDIYYYNKARRSDWKVSEEYAVNTYYVRPIAKF